MQAQTDREPTRKLKSCLACRSVKIRCTTVDNWEACDRCRKGEQPCERPASRPSGRPKGSKNNLSALERAFQTIRNELGAAPSGSLPSDQSQDTIWTPRDSTIRRRDDVAHPQEGIGKGKSAAPFAEAPTRAMPEASSSPRPSVTVNTIPSIPATSSLQAHEPPVEVSPHSLDTQHTRNTDDDNDGSLANPVRLLAEAAEEGQDISSQDQLAPQDLRPDRECLPSEYTLPSTLRALLQESPIDAHIVTLALDVDYLARGLETLLASADRQTLSPEDKRFFRPARQLVKRDLGDEYDPVALALVTAKEVQVYFATFFLKLHPMLSVLDPILHTPDFVRGRSAFLLTAICAHGASLTTGSEETTKRLRIHAQRLSELMSRRGFASVEIVQAFLIWISWLPSSQPFQEERLWHETKYAINMAVELGVSQTMTAATLAGTGEGLAADLAACLADLPSYDTAVVDRVVRNRQRLWLHLFLWDSSLSLAFGKATRFNQDSLIRNETWCFHDLATEHDKITTACVVLRRRLVGLTDALRSEILARAHTSSDWVLQKVEDVLVPWHTYWTSHCGWSPYLELMLRHTRLWSLSYALQTLSSRGGNVHALMSDCFAASVSSCEFACQQLQSSRNLWGFPNTMGPMLSFEALLAVRLFPMTTEKGHSSRGRLLGLISQLALLLENVGSTPPHRLGTAAVYGRHLQVYIRRRIVALCASHHQYETGQYHGGETRQIPAGLQDGSPATSAEALFNQLFSGTSYISPSDQVQTSMNLTWDGADPLSFLDTSGWTEDFFRSVGGQS